MRTICSALSSTSQVSPNVPSQPSDHRRNERRSSGRRRPICASASSISDSDAPGRIDPLAEARSSIIVVGDMGASVRPGRSGFPPPGEEARRPGVAPDEAELGWRVGPRTRGLRFRQCLDPQGGRATELRGEELRVANDELAIALDIANDPAAEDPMRTVPANSDRLLRHFRPLAVRAPDRRANVAKRVPALHQDQDPGAVVTEPDVGRATGIRWSGPELEGAAVAGSAAKSHDELLDREMSGVRWLLASIAAKLDPHWSVDSQGEALPRIEGVTAASTTLDRSDRCAGNPDPGPELSLTPAPPEPGRLQGGAERDHLFKVEAGRFSGEVGMLELGHARCMIIPRAWRAVSPQSTPNSAAGAAGPDQAEHELPGTSSRATLPGDLKGPLALGMPMQRARPDLRGRASADRAGKRAEPGAKAPT